MSFRIVFPVLAFLAALAFRGADIPSPGVAPAQAEEDEWQGLPPGKGREATYFTCGPCHSVRLVTQQGLSAARWNETIDWMVDEQEMPKLEAANRKLIVDYLAHFYGEDRKAKGGRRKQP